MPTTPLERVAFFLPTLDVGGVERVICQLAAAIADAGALVDVVAGNAEGPAAVDVPPAARLVDLRARRTAQSLLPLARYLREERPTVIVSAKDHASVIAVLASQLVRPRIPVVVTVHSRPSDALRAPERWTGSVVRRMVPFVYRRAAAIVAVSSGVAEDVRAHVPSSGPAVRVIADPVISRAFLEAGGRPPGHAWLGPDRETPVIVWCGRLSPEKDPIAALEAFARVRARRQIRMLFVGDGPLRVEVERRAGELDLDDCVHITGLVRNAASFLSHADVVVLSSRREGLPTVLIEALALELGWFPPIVELAHARLLADGAYGRLVPVGDIDALADAVDLSLDGPAPSVPAAALAPYDVTTAASHYLELFEEVCTR